jgi:hypothetical protein
MYEGEETKNYLKYNKGGDYKELTEYQCPDKLSQSIPKKLNKTKQLKQK